jgi:hypothetical protein
VKAKLKRRKEKGVNKGRRKKWQLLSDNRCCECKWFGTYTTCKCIIYLYIFTRSHKTL